ncbi:serine/arginine repetitive matrix protein 1 [Biomphalaria glabrata]|nr:serine/arginine repetitive matrix protein 1 [Biomphalaria glabrata]
MLPIDVISRNNDDSFTFTWSQRAITSHSLPDGLMECAHPAKTVLRPRHGHEYVVIKRKAKMLTTSHLHSASGRVSTFDLEHNDTLSVLSSLSTPQNSPTFSTVEGPSKSIYPDLAFFQPTMSPCSTINPSCSALSNNDSGQREDVCAENIFFPVDLCGFSPPPSPFYPKSSPNQEVHYPIYVNQEFTSKHVQPSIRHVSSSSSQSSVSPTKTNVLSIMSSIFSPKPNSPFGDFPSSQQKKYHSLRHSDPDPGKFENFQLSIPMVIASEKDAMKNIQTSNKSSSDRVPRKEYEKFVSSSIISRRNQFAEDQRLAEAMSTSSSSQQLQVPTIKSSGYKNIDSLNAAAAAERSSASTEAISAKYLTLPRGLGLTYTSQVNSFSKAVSSQIDMTSNQLKPLSSCDPYSNSADTLPYHCDPPPPIRIRHISSSSSSSHSSSPCLTPVDSSDSPPSYYAPSPPYTPPAPPSTPPPPMVPPRHRLLPPAPLEVPTSPSENTSDSSDDEQELNYIEVDMTKASDEPAQHPPTVYFRPHKRPKKVKDSAKMRYVLIDHSATKALQQARQEHVQARDGTQVKSASQLNRINSAPASSKKKHFTFISRERKLSSGSVESC